MLPPLKRGPLLIINYKLLIIDYKYYHLHRKSSTHSKSSCSLLSRGIHVLKHNLLMGDSLSPGMLINMLLSFAAIIVIIARLWLLKIYMSYVHFHIQKLKNIQQIWLNSLSEKVLESSNFHLMENFASPDLNSSLFWLRLFFP